LAKQEKFYKSSGNVFEDIGSSHPKRVLDRAKLMEHISDFLEKYA
jgi:predicted XRE-type DNA-binding protein